MDSSEFQKLFNRIECVSTPKGDYAIYEDGDKETHKMFHLCWGVYLFFPQDNKKINIDKILDGFAGIDCLCYDGSDFLFLEGVESPTELALTLPNNPDTPLSRINNSMTYGMNAITRKMKWTAKDLLHLYMQLADNDLQVDEKALTTFLQRTGHIEKTS